MAANILICRYVEPPNGVRPDAMTIGRTRVFQVRTGAYEDVPAFGGMSGGPVFSYIEDIGPGAWSAEKQLAFYGILHQEEPESDGSDGVLLAHQASVVRDLIHRQLHGFGSEEFLKSLDRGFKSDNEEVT